MATMSNVTPDEVVCRLNEKLSVIDWEKAKSDIAPFIRDPQELNPWSTEFFVAACRWLRFE